MPSSLRSIQPLPDEVRSRLSSTIEIRSLLDAVEHLFRNSLDADAQVVRIEVDFKKGYCSVIDDGEGIAAAEFQPGSLLAQEHCTSKSGKSDCYGTHGKALASIAALSLLSITSSQRGYSAHTSTICYGKWLSSGPGLLDAADDGEPSGTKVIVHNLFGNVPVRFKAQALQCSIPGEIDRLFHLLQRRLIAYVLAGSSSVTVTLHVRGTALGYRHKPAKMRISLPYFSGDLVHHVLKQANLLPTSDASKWKLASAKAGGISIRIAVFQKPLPSKQCQFISFGRWPVHNNASGSSIFDLVNEVFHASRFGRDADSGDSDHNGSQRDESLAQVRKRQRQSMAERVDRWPGFYIRIDCNNQELAALVDDQSADTNNDMQQVFVLLKVLLRKYLGRNSHASDRKSAYPRDNSKSNRSRADSFSMLKRTRSAFPTDDSGMHVGLPFVGNSKPSTSNSFDADVQLLLDDIELDEDPFPNMEYDSFSEINQDAPESQNPSEGSLSDALSWTNPKTGKVIRLNDNSFVVPGDDDSTSKSPVEHFCCEGESMGGRRQWKKPTVDRKALAERLKSWPISTFASRAEDTLQTSALNCEHAPLEIMVDSASIEETLSASDLANARVLRQVDEKFILIIMREAVATGSLLVLIDQHAADERIKVERLYRELCSGHSTALSKPLHIEMDSRELELLDAARQHFLHWGVAYQRSHVSPTALLVTQLPALIAERCRQDPKVLIDLIREEIWADRPKTSLEKNPVANSSFLDQIAQCPRGLVEMINSRACRSAIMFNDVLSLEQCRTLLADLSKCVLPFQCAHSRPSLTVLTRLGPEGFGNAFDSGSRSFKDAFEDWI